MTLIERINALIAAIAADIKALNDFEEVDLSALATKTGTETLTNKRLTPRVSTLATAATLTPNADTQDLCVVTGLATALTINAPSGSPTDGQVIRIRISTAGAARNLTWNEVYQSTAALPTSLQAGKVLHAPAYYNAASLTWEIPAVNLINLPVSSLMNGLIDHFDFEETSGQAISAVSGGHTSAQNTATLQATGKIGKCYSFGTGYVRFSGAILASQSFTISAWIKTTATNENTIFAGSDGGSIHFRVNAGILQFLKRAQFGIVNGSTAVNTGDWVHGVVTNNGATGEMILYVNATADATATNQQTYVFSSDDNIGAVGGGEIFNGSIDLVDLYNRVLTPAEITVLYNNGLGKAYPY